MVAIAAAVLVAFIAASTSLRIIKKKSLKPFRVTRSSATAFLRSLKSAGATLKSWKAASLAYVRLPSLLPGVK
jgi:hypothetical protein